MNNPPALTPAATLRLAAGVIRENGWIQGSYSFGGKVCANGAMAKAYGSWSFSSVQDAFAEFLYRESTTVQSYRDGGYPRYGDGPPGEICAWNNEPAQTADNIAATMERCAAELEAT